MNPYSCPKDFFFVFDFQHFESAVPRSEFYFNPLALGFLSSVFFFVCSLYFKYLSLVIYYHKDNDHPCRILRTVCRTLQNRGST